MTVLAAVQISMLVFWVVTPRVFVDISVFRRNILSPSSGPYVDSGEVRS
jgi:hypothetical protein